MRSSPRSRWSRNCTQGGIMQCSILRIVRHLPGLAAVTALTMVGASCGTTTPTPIDGAVFLVRACGDQHFRVQIRDPAVISEADRLVGADRQRVIGGELRRGSGDVNAPWSWHLDPETIGFADVTIELCDGCPDFVESDLDYWVDTVGRYCPWSTRMLQRLR